jgi:hypothetical protein
MTKRIKKFSAPSPDTIEIVVDTIVADLTGDVTGNVTGNLTGNVTGNCSGSSGSCTGNAATATLATSATSATTATSATSATSATTAGTCTGNSATATVALGLRELGGQDLPLAAISDGLYLKRSGTAIIGSIPAGAGDVLAPATNTANYVPQWNGTDSKTLKNGYPVSATAAASTIVLSDGSSKIDTWVSDASSTVQGKVELATSAETTTGTDATRAVTPDGLAGSEYGKQIVGIQAFESGTNTATGDGIAFFRIPPKLNGYNLVSVAACVYTAGTTGTTDIQIRNKTDSQDMLSTKITIDSGETDTLTAATAAVINTSYDDVATGDLIAIDVDAISTTPAKGLYVELVFQLP